MLELLEMTNKKDNKNELFSKGHTYQLQLIQQFLLKNKDLQIFKCNIFINDEIIL